MSPISNVFAIDYCPICSSSLYSSEYAADQYYYCQYDYYGKIKDANQSSHYNIQSLTVHDNLYSTLYYKSNIIIPPFKIINYQDVKISHIYSYPNNKHIMTVPIRNYDYSNKEETINKINSLVYLI